MPTYTTTYSLGKPVVGADEDAWGDTLNTSLDAIDDILDGTTPVTGIDINSGTLDGVTIGGTTAGAGTFTTLTATTSITGTLATAAQPNVTSLGTLTGLTVSGSTSLAGASTSADITFGDNDKAIFGAGSDLQIYHDGSASYIIENGPGDLNIQSNGSNLNLLINGGENAFTAANNGAVTLYYDNAAKLATTSTGIDVTGTVTADGLISNLNVNSTTVPTTRSSYQIAVEVDGAHTGDYVGGIAFGDQALATAQAAILVADRGASAATGLAFATGNSAALTQRMRIDDIGDISFYEDTGTTAKFFWDASAESLGIGTSSPAKQLHIESSTGGTLRLSSSDTSVGAGESLGQIDWYSNDASGSGSGVRAFVNVVENDGGLGRAYDMTFGTGQVATATERMRIDSSGNVGIGTTSPSSYNSNADNLVIQDSGNAGITIATTDSAYFSQINFADGTSGAQAYTGILRYAHSDNSLRIIVNTGEKMRIDSSGNLLVGQSTLTAVDTSSSVTGYAFASDGRGSISRNNGIALALNRLTTDGNILEFKKDASAVGNIGTTSGTIWFAGNSTQNTGIRCYTVGIAPCDSAGVYKDNSRDLGSLTVRWDDVYATNGTIQTSDQNEKQDIAELSDAEQRVAVAAKGLLRKFRWRDAVAEKGDEARTHFGIIAQDLQAAFEAEGLDAGDYAMFIHSTWTDEETGEERSRMGVRYSELLAFIIAAI